ncbi:MAG: glutathione S-transferase [Pseudomonadota bacterium]
MSAKLYIFAISHYCEKARWALDYLQIDYELVFLAPGLHIATARKFGLKASSVPFLDTGQEIIQGSAKIIDWAEEYSRSDYTLIPGDSEETSREIEKRLDKVSGVHVRRMFYSEALVEHSSTVKVIFTKDLPTLQKFSISVVWPFIRKLMIKAMDLGREQGEESQKIIDNELRWLDSLLADGRPYLVGEQFSRADLTACALYARTARPKEHPAAASMLAPPRLAQTQSEWDSRPSLKWIRKTYSQDRHHE